MGFGSHSPFNSELKESTTQFTSISLLGVHGSFLAVRRCLSVSIILFKIEERMSERESIKRAWQIGFSCTNTYHRNNKWMLFHSVQHYVRETTAIPHHHQHNKNKNANRRTKAAAATADYTNLKWSKRVLGCFVHSFIQLWWNGKTFYCRLLIEIVDP